MPKLRAALETTMKAIVLLISPTNQCSFAGLSDCWSTPQEHYVKRAAPNALSRRRPKGSDYLIGNSSLRPCGVFNRSTNVAVFALSLAMISSCSC